MAISYFALPDSGGGRFPLLLLGCVCDILQYRQIFAFADALIAQIYYELWMYTTGRRTGIDVSFVLHCWAYEHIAVIRPSGLPWMPAAVGGVDYGFRRWRADMAAGDTGRSAEWYSERFRTLTPDQ
ncbi:hypothetical protein KI387_031329, partial [Taxus chinensis]